MAHLSLTETARQLPQAWSSRIVARLGEANLKLVRMDGTPYPEEYHDYAEGLLVLEGEMVLQLEGLTLRVKGGELYVVPPGVPHSVSGGSQGTLLIIDV